MSVLRHEDLQGPQFLENQVLGLINGPHATLTDLADDPVLFVDDITGLPFLKILSEFDVGRAVIAFVAQGGA
jgi:hypothetical protein